MAQRKVEPLPDILRRIVRDLDIEAKLIAHAVEPAWPRAAGERLAGHTRATRLHDGILTIEARSASWLNELSLLREPIRDRLNVALGGQRVRDLRFRIGADFPPLAASGHGIEASDLEVASARRTLASGGAVGADLVARAYVLASKRALR